MSLADESGTDVEIYRRYGDDSVYVDIRTGAPERLVETLDDIGTTLHSDGPYTWRQLPVEGRTEEEIRQSATGALVILATAGYRTNLDPELFDRATQEALLAYTADMREHYRRQDAARSPRPAHPAAMPGTPAGGKHR
ncbi:hypothetical protein OIE62_07680 [Streptomyces scopuliridis]|uniref:Uncharacterized protein n=1 Tax=Streptomyces scopuliridis TaxID=452529 RepID=A0ACD4ZUC3_9ACTN|nr:hypothetical protein [Streptomyces scopuliridis]WSC01554.1 hypothetical protein OG835_34140 [Streptomyces scopuliridis]WSC04908.1 hypothetical protein OIE62_07680 [Streptomyces scopuliridis]